MQYFISIYLECVSKSQRLPVGRVGLALRQELQSFLLNVVCCNTNPLLQLLDGLLLALGYADLSLEIIGAVAK